MRSGRTVVAGSRTKISRSRGPRSDGLQTVREPAYLRRPMTAALPARARVVVVGGGIIGCSVAYHLAHMGWNDVVLLERDQLTSGTTWHAAGLMVTFGSTSETSTEMRKYTRDLYARLEAETGQSHRLQAVPASSRSPRDPRSPRGVPPRLGVQPATAGSTSTRSRRRRSRTCSRSRASTTCSPASTSRRTAARIRSASTMALAKGARQQGVTILEGVPVTGVHEAARRGDRRDARRRATSRPSTSSTAPACGRASSARRSASTSRCRRPSTTT